MVNISKICISNPRKTNSFVKCHHFFPSVLKRKIFGELLFLIEIEIPKNLTSESINFCEEISEIIINGMKTNYYAKEILEGEEIEEIFESSLQKLNRLIYQESISSRFFDLLIKNLNAVIVLVKEEKIYFSPTGSIKAFILKKNKIIDLVSEKISPSPSKVFSQIISGNLEKKDSLFFSTNNFLDYFLFEEFNKIVLENSVNEITRKLENILENLKDKISLGAFIIREEIEEEKKLEKEVEKVEKIPVKIKVFPEKEKVEKIVVKEKISVVPERKEIKKEKSVKKIKLPKIYFGEIKKLLSKLSLLKIKILPIVILIALIFPITLFIRSEKIKERGILEFFTSLEEIQEKNALLKVSSKYESREKISKLAQEISEKINALKPKNNLEKAILERFKNSFQSTLDEVYKIKKVVKPNIIADYRKIEAENIIKLGNYLFTLDKKTGTIYQLNLKEKKIEKIASLNLTGKLEELNLDNLLIYNDQKISLFNLKNKKLSPLKLETSEKNFFINELKVYDGKIYILNSKINQILKYLPIKTGFGKESLWLKEKIDLKDINSFAIDGSIYLLKNNEVLKFYLGKKVGFALEKIHPQFEKLEKISTNSNFKNIYLLEPKNKRILIFNKNGGLVKQIISEDFIDLKDFVVNENETKIWLLEGTKIIELEI